MDGLSHQKLDEVDAMMWKEHEEFTDLLQRLKDGTLSESGLDLLGEHVYKID